MSAESKCKCPDGLYCIHKDGFECIYPRKKFQSLEGYQRSLLKRDQTSLSTEDPTSLRTVGVKK